MKDEFNRLHSTVNRIEIKVDAIGEQVSGQNVRLEVYNAELQKHIEGVKLAREENRMIREALESRTTDLAERLAPLKADYERKRTIWTFLKKVAIFAGGVIGAISAWKSLKG